MEADGTEIAHLGHTTFMIRRRGTAVLIDPVLARPHLEFRRASESD
jgi:L-ascorbate metabolism protein UlaG (beta-lactamase superfamily)